MGQKVHPVGMRLGIIHEHNSIWYASSKNYAAILRMDLEVREMIRKRLAEAWVSRIQIDRLDQSARIVVHTARPGIVIGKKGEGIERLRKDVEAKMGVATQIDVEEIRMPELDAALIAQSIAQQLERRVQFRRAMRRAIQSAMRLKAKGIKIRVAGRLGGVEIARSETYHEGRVPLHTLRADIDYAVVAAKTNYGIIGIKVWVFKGEIIGKNQKAGKAGKEATIPAAAIGNLSAS